MIIDMLNTICISLTQEAYSEPCQTSKIERFEKTVNGWNLLTSFEKPNILHFCQDSENLCLLQLFCK